MVLAMITLSLAAGSFAYTGLPKEGEPDIEIPAIFISVVFPGISAADSEKLLVMPMETELSNLRFHGHDQELFAVSCGNAGEHD